MRNVREQILKLHNYSESDLIEFMKNDLKIDNQKNEVANIKCIALVPGKTPIEDVYYVKYTTPRGNVLFTRFRMDENGKLLPFDENSNGFDNVLYSSKAMAEFRQAHGGEYDTPKKELMKMWVVWGGY